ncbi:MAG: DUF1501 domain-containing protein [Planctomycetota bacterium]|nr:DUF1501 domain-containing protein [Planctomycetota bacterium]MDA1214483.1 DUF1501 domain-containing protein [Planctomycetota bacterium]
MNPLELNYQLTRRRFLNRTSAGLGAAAVTGLLNPQLFAANDMNGNSGAMGRPHFPAKAKRVIYLFMAGGPSQIDIFDPKPKLKELNGQELPPSVKGEQRITLMTRNQKQLLVAASPMKFITAGESGQVMNEHLPNLGKVSDEIAIIRSITSEPINHDPAVNMMQTGAGRAGRPCIGSWLSWGLGSENKNLPDFVVLLSGNTGQPVITRYYHSGFLPSRHQGVHFQSKGDPVLFLTNPKGIDLQTRGELIDGINRLNQRRLDVVGDPEIEARINSFELAYRMQSSVPDLMDLSSESKQTHEMYGTNPGEVSFANNCLLARRLVERGVRFVQLYMRDWDMHSNIIGRMPDNCKVIDQPIAALITDLKQRGMLDETLIIWGGEFGRTTYCQGDLKETFGRDHHPRCFSMWLAGGGIKGGITHGQTDDFGYNVVSDGVHVHDLQATILHCLGIDHERMTFRFQGRDQRLTDIGGNVVQPLLV